MIACRSLSQKTSILTGEVAEKLDQAGTSFSSILVIFLDSENSFFYHFINLIIIL